MQWEPLLVMADPQCSRPTHSSAHHFVLQASNLIFSYLCVLQGPPELGKNIFLQIFFSYAFLTPATTTTQKRPSFGALLGIL
jgi:hypothetical protein